MKKEILRKIIAGEKRNIIINGHKYEIFIDKNAKIVKLFPHDNYEYIAWSEFPYKDYKAREGSSVYKKAVEIAKEIAKALYY
jgi:hypothetical protein